MNKDLKNENSKNLLEKEKPTQNSKWNKLLAVGILTLAIIVLVGIEFVKFLPEGTDLSKALNFLSNSGDSFPIGTFIAIIIVVALVSIIKSNKNSNPYFFSDEKELKEIDLILGEELFCLDTETNTELRTKIEEFRKNLDKNLGYKAPEVNITQSKNLYGTCYEIYVGTAPTTGDVYPDKVMIFAQDWERYYEEEPEDSIADVYPLDASDIYWITPEKATELGGKIPTFTPNEVIIRTIEYALIKSNYDVITEQYAYNYLNEAKEDANLADIATKLEKTLTAYSLKIVFSSLIQEGISIKDKEFLLQNISKSTEIKDFTEEMIIDNLRNEISEELCLKYADENKILKVYEISDIWNKKFEKAHRSDLFGISFYMDYEVLCLFSQDIQKAMQKAGQTLGTSPIILCPIEYRTALSHELNLHCPDAVLLADTEISKKVTVEKIGIIGEIE